MDSGSAEVHVSERLEEVQVGVAGAACGAQLPVLGLFVLAELDVVTLSEFVYDEEPGVMPGSLVLGTRVA